MIGLSSIKVIENSYIPVAGRERYEYDYALIRTFTLDVETVRTVRDKRQRQQQQHNQYH